MASGAKSQKGFVHPKPNIHKFVAMADIVSSTGHVISKNPQTERFDLKDKDGRLITSTFSVLDAKATILDDKKGDPTATFSDNAEVQAQLAELHKTAGKAEVLAS